MLKQVNKYSVKVFSGFNVDGKLEEYLNKNNINPKDIVKVDYLSSEATPSNGKIPGDKIFLIIHNNELIEADKDESTTGALN